MDDQQERAVAQGLREGKADAWRALYEAYAERVWWTVARLLGPYSADVADVVQESFLAAARSASTFDISRGTLWLWLWGIARRHVALHFRKAERHNRLRQGDNGSLLDWPDQREPAPGETLEAAEQTAQIRAVLVELPDDYAFLLTAKYLDGESVDAIATRERTTNVAIRSKLARARQAFRHAFLKYGEESSVRFGRGDHDSTRS